MLSTTIYNRALNLAAENCRAAVYHHDEQEAAKQARTLLNILDYGHKHGLILASVQRPGMLPIFYFKRNGYRPDRLHIQIVRPYPQ